jgi:hypothetical protein
MKKEIHNLLNRISDYRFHQAQKKSAERILKELETVKGKTDKVLIKLSDDYAKDILGWHGFAPWLHVYCAVNNEFREGWFPDNYYAKIVLPVISGDYGKLSDHKLLSGYLFQKDVFPDIACYVNKLFIANDNKVVEENRIKELLFEDRDIVVYKIDNSMQGKGVFLFDKTTFDLNRIKILGNGVFQYYIKQHSFFSELMPDSVATIRLTTYYEDNGEVSVRGSYLRIGRASERSIRWSSNIFVPVDINTGELASQGYYPNLLPLSSHPDTQIPFTGRRIPFFNKCYSTAVELHKQLPFDRCIGWDMVIDRDNNVNVMEWNGDHTDIKIHEAIQGPCFADLGWENFWKTT